MSDIHAAIARLERAQHAVSDVLMPPAAEWTPPNERYARGLDLIRLGVTDALVMLRRVAGEPAIPEPSLVHFSLLTFGAVSSKTVCGADASAVRSDTVPGRVTCPACREWVEQNLAVPETEPAADKLNRAVERGGEEGS